MRLTEEELKAILQRQTARGTPRQAECLTDDEFAQAAAGEINDETRLRIASHLVTCSDCTNEYRVVRSLRPLAGEADRVLLASGAAGPEPALETVRPLHRSQARRVDRLTPSGSRADRSGWRARRFAAIAAMLLAVVGSVVIWQSIKPQDSPVSTERAPVALKLTVDPPDRASVSAPPEKLTWSGVEQALSYRVVIYDSQSTPIWESVASKETSATLPDSVREG